MNRLIQYVISAKDATASAVSAALQRVKDFGSTVAKSMEKAKKGLDTGAITDKFVNTADAMDVLDAALESIGVRGQDLGDALTVLNRRIDNINKGTGSASEIFDHLKSSMADFGATSKQIAEAQNQLRSCFTVAGRAAIDQEKGIHKLAVAFEKLKDKVKDAAQAVSNGMKKAINNMNTQPLTEKFVKTQEVLTKMGTAFTNLGVSSADAKQYLDEIKLKLDEINRTGKGAGEFLSDMKQKLKDLGASAKQCAEAQRELKKSFIKGGKDMSESFNPLKAITAAVHGNFGALGSELAKLIPSIKKMGASGATAVGAFGAALMSVIGFLKSLAELTSVAFNLKSMPQEITKASSEMASLVNATEQFYENMKEAREHSEKVAESLKEQISAMNELVKAQNELNRAKELTAAKTEDERKAINDKYDRMNAGEDSKAKQKTLAVERQQLEEESQRLKAELAKSRSDQEENLRRMRRYNMKAQHNTNGAVMETLSHIGHGFGLFGNTSTEEARAWNRNAQAASDAYDEAVEKEYEVKKQMEENAAKLETMRIKQKTERVKEEARKQKNIADDIADAQKKADKKAKEDEKAALKKKHEEEKAALKKKHEEEKAELKKQRDAERAANKEKRAEERAAAKEKRDELRADAKAAREEEKRIHKEKQEQVKQERALLSQLNKDVSKQQHIVEAAQKKVTDAWGWYKDRDKLKEQIEDEEKDIAARKKYAKDSEEMLRAGTSLGKKFSDAKRLLRKGDYDKLDEQMMKWRQGSFGMSLDEEATMRVALAKEEERMSRQSLRNLEEQSEKQTEYLDQITKALNGGGEE